MPVTNLNLDVETVADALLTAFWGKGTAGNGCGDEAFESRVAERAGVLASDDWLWDQTPPFTWTGETRPGPLTATVRGGLVEDIRDDRSLNLSNMVGKRFFAAEFFDYIRTREVV